MQRVYSRSWNKLVHLVQRGCSHRNATNHIEVRERGIEHLKGFTVSRSVKNRDRYSYKLSSSNIDHHTESSDEHDQS